MILVIDNYDSFTYNLVQYLGMLGAEIETVRNDEVSAEEVDSLQPEKIVISPGPGTPDKAGICKDVVRRCSGKIPLLGVCLGHQCIGEVFGLPVVGASKIVHGKTSVIIHSGTGLFAGIPQNIKATRYHSLVLSDEIAAGKGPGAAASELVITARTAEGVIMAVQHKNHATYGLQFHPESVATEYGLDILKNFLAVRG